RSHEDRAVQPPANHFASILRDARCSAWKRSGSRNDSLSAASEIGPCLLAWGLRGWVALGVDCYL
ncbi:hypothetical protein CHARACLAT_010922, partial [Characodon lateralis]|nr:hypothetical protein [Characodon lateralis]